MLSTRQINEVNISVAKFKAESNDLNLNNKQTIKEWINLNVKAKNYLNIIKNKKINLIEILLKKLKINKKIKNINFFYNINSSNNNRRNFLFESKTFLLLFFISFLFIVNIVNAQTLTSTFLNLF